MKNVNCQHGKQKGHCRECKPEKYCAHKVHRSHCRICYPLGWAKGILAVARGAARRRSQAAPKITAEGLIALSSEKLCFLCGGVLDWSKAAHLHHNHRTGEVYGFTHQLCNQAEGMLSRLTKKQLAHFIRTAFVALGNEGR